MRTRYIYIRLVQPHRSPQTGRSTAATTAAAAPSTITSCCCSLHEYDRVPLLRKIFALHLIQLIFVFVVPVILTLESCALNIVGFLLIGWLAVMSILRNLVISRLDYSSGCKFVQTIYVGRSSVGFRFSHVYLDAILRTFERKSVH